MIFANRVMFYSGLKKKKFVTVQLLICFVLWARLYPGSKLTEVSIFLLHKTEEICYLLLWAALYFQTRTDRYSCFEIGCKYIYCDRLPRYQESMILLIFISSSFSCRVYLNGDFTNKRILFLWRNEPTVILSFLFEK